MRQPPQTGLDAANQNGHILVGLADEVAVDNGGIVRALAHHPAGGKGIGFPPVLGDGIMVYHAVHVAAADQKAQPGAAKHIDGFWIFPVRLGDDAHAVAMALQNPGDDGMTEGGMIHIGIPAYIYKIALFPAAIHHFLLADRQKFHVRYSFLGYSCCTRLISLR